MKSTRALLLLALASAPAVAAPSQALRWEQIFAADGGPAVHARAHYRDPRGGEHALELWRNRHAVRRDTDGKLTIVVGHRPGQEDRYRVIDRDRGRSFDATRSSLLHIGMFPEWTQLTSLLTRPRGEPAITAMARTAEHGAAGECRWYQIGGDKPSHRVCWSERLKLPLVVQQAAAAGWTNVITVDSAEVASIPAERFSPSVDGTVRVDVDSDLD